MCKIFDENTFHPDDIKILKNILNINSEIKEIAIMDLLQMRHGIIFLTDSKIKPHKNIKIPDNKKYIHYFPENKT